MAANVFDQFDQQATNPFDQFDAPVAQKPEKTGMLRAAADIPVQVGRGVAVGVKALSDVFGADNPVSRAAFGVEDFLGGLLSAQAKNDQAEIARIMKEAQDKGVGDQVTAAVKAFATAPVDMLSQALGTAVPVIAGGLAGSVARLGAMGVGAIGTGVGAAMGAGTVKGQIYDAVKQELLANKVPEAEAEKRAQEAQAYGGKNLDQILMGAGIGAAEAAFGAERILTGLLRKGAVKPSALPAATRILTAAATEAVPEMAQAAQEQVAQNIALQREGYDVPTMRGVVGQAALEGIAGMGLGAITGAVQRTVPEAKVTKEAKTPEGKVAGRTTVVTDEETAARLRNEQAAGPQPLEAESPKPVTVEAGVVQPEEAQVSREVEKEARPTIPELRTRIDREAELQRQREQAGFEIERTMAEEQIATARERGMPAREERPDYIDLRPLRTPLEQRQAMAIAREEARQEGIDPQRLELVPHPKIPEAMTIVRRAVTPEVKAPEPTIRPEEAQRRIEEAAAEGQKVQRRREDEARQVVLNRALKNIEERGGIASPEEARVVEEANIGKPYDRVDDSLGRTLSTDERLTEATGILVGRVAETMPEAPIPPKKTLEEVPTPERRVPSGLTEEEITRRLQQARGEVAPEPPVTTPTPPIAETPPEVTPPREKQPPVTSYEQFLERLPEAPEVPAVRQANDAGDFRQLVGALKQSQNPVIKRIGELGDKIANKTTLRKPGVIKEMRRAAGVYRHSDDSIQMNQKYAGSEQINAHETLHALVAKAQRAPTEKQKSTVKKIELLYQHVKRELAKQGIKPRNMYGLKNQYEFVAEAMSDPKFQYTLMQIPYKGNQSAWSAFVQMVADLLGIENTNALTEVMALTEKLAQMQPRRRKTTDAVIEAAEKKPEAAIAEEAPAPSVKPEPTYRGQVGKETPPVPTTAGQQALDTINQLGMGVKEPEGNLYEQAKKKFKAMGESPAGTKAEIKEAVRKFFANIETKTMSSDARWDSDIKNGLRQDMKPVKDIIGASLLASQSQAVGADAVSTRAMLIGGATYDEKAIKWVAYENKDANEVVKAKVLDEIAAKYGLTKEEASQVAHTYLVAANYEGIIKRNAKLEEQIKALKEEGKNDEADDLEAALVFVSEKQAAMVEPGKSIAGTIPEVKKIAEIWNEQRRMVKDVMVFSGLWRPEYADAMMDNAAYVPFYRETQIDADEGPRIFMRGLQVKAKEHKLKGSETAVNNVFENMAMWQQYAMNRAIRNHKAVQSIDVGKTIQVGDRKMAEQVKEPKRGMNVVKIWRKGKQEFYEVADPYYVEAFQTLGAVYIEPIKYFTAISNILRKTVVMYPLFSIGQLTQDSVAAIFASGLKPQYAFKIPYLAVKEFGKTMMGWSTTHDELKNYGAVGVRDFNAAVAREDAAITAGVKAPRGAWGKVNYMLERVAMSADNAVRQAMYIAATEAKLSKAEALEKAFEIINFRRRGSSKLLNLMGQTVPFFYAYLSAQRVAYKTLTGTGISPTERKAALETLAQTTAAVMALSFIYAMANGDDEEYKKTPSTIRDRSLMIPGSGGVRIPLRPDFFLFPKVIAEHTYQLLTDEGYSDGAKFRKSMADLLANATLSPNAVPQIIKPTFEAAINYSFFEGKPIVGFFEQNKEAGRQFNDSTSEMAKWFGQFGASPQMVDHLVRGYFGSVGGLVLWGTNFFIEGEPGVPRPEITAHDMFVTMPGVGAFKQKPTENALKVDFYELRDAIAKVKNTYDDMKVRSPEGLEAFIQDEKNLARLAMDKQITKIGDHLSKIRRAIQQVAAAPESRMSASEKQERIKELRDVEMDLLKAVDVKALRAQAKL